jgi:hypothetical protein
MKKAVLMAAVLFIASVSAYSNASASSELASVSIINTACQAYSMEHINVCKHDIHKKGHKNAKLAFAGLSQAAGGKNESNGAAGYSASVLGNIGQDSLGGNNADLTLSEMIFKQNRNITIARSRK